MTDYLLNTEEAAEMLGVKASTLKKYRCIGGGPQFVKISTRVVYRKVDLDEYVSARIYDNTSQYLH